MNNNKGKIVVYKKVKYERVKSTESCDFCELQGKMSPCPYLDECMLTGTVFKKKQDKSV